MPLAYVCGTARPLLSLFQFKIKDEIKAARKRRHRRTTSTSRKLMTKPTKIAL
ncbi:MAG: hypothetical protein NT178_07325 [Proteobacteria bacterium]|nr:hypothetical protein [Pseudomonadota bacterium]